MNPPTTTSIDAEGAFATNAGGHELPFMVREGASAVTRGARTPLRRSTAENGVCGLTDANKGHASPGAATRGRMSMFALSPHGPSTLRTPKTPQTPKTPKTPKTLKPVRFGAVSPDHTPTKTADLGLQKQCAELYAKLTGMAADYQHVENELARKNGLVDELTQKMHASERRVRVLEDEQRKQAELQQQEVAFYRDSLEELRRQNSRLSRRLEQDQHMAEALTQEHDSKYLKLYKSYQALQSNFELEQNLRALLIDQIEFLTKERDLLLASATPLPSVDLHLPQDFGQTLGVLAGQNSDEDDHEYLHSDASVDADPESEPESDSDGSVHGTRLLGSYAEHDFESSSPLKDDPHNFLGLSLDFQFPAPNTLQHAPPLPQTANPSRPFSPPHPDEKAKSLKRMSLPLQLKLNASFEDDFVLSPLKLTPHPNSAYFDSATAAAGTGAATGPSVSGASAANSTSNTRPNSIIRKRYSGTKLNHSRYNSHDILPIKVEFELLNHQLRSASAPDKDHLHHQLSSVAESNPIEDSDMAFMKLNGFGAPSKRDSMMTDSSKRSSFISDFNVLSGDITKQEITKLKFELQSLKLHNEKLLSYIGFELQKQKKNIKKLSSKQNLRPPKKPTNSMEYSDAKLIEKLKEMLIHKKRVLRSVSINPILSTKYGGRNTSGAFQPLVGLGVLGNPAEDDDDFVFKSHFISSLKKDDCDDYGFLNHNCKYNLRVLSKNNQEYSEYNDEQTLKKHKSQTFGSAGQLALLDFSSADESFLLINGEPRFDDGDFAGFTAEIDAIDEPDDRDPTSGDLNEEWESSSDKSAVSDVEFGKLNPFNQMKYLILGKEHLKKNKRADSMVDENMKYKFLTIAIGIVIVGIKFTTHPQHQLSGS